MPDYVVRITHSYAASERIIHAWALRSTHMAVYEHGPPEAKEVHVHLLILGTQVDKKQLRNIAADATTKEFVKGNENMSFGQSEWDGSDKYMSYMTKGKHDPKYLLNFTMEQHEKWKAAWVEPKKYVKISKNTMMYQDFIRSQGYDIEQEQVNKLYQIQKSAKYYVRVVLGLEISVPAANIYKMLARTYCYDNDISIPKGDKLDW